MKRLIFVFLAMSSTAAMAAVDVSGNWFEGMKSYPHTQYKQAATPQQLTTAVISLDTNRHFADRYTILGARFNKERIKINEDATWTGERIDCFSKEDCTERYAYGDVYEFNGGALTGRLIYEYVKCTGRFVSGKPCAQLWPMWAYGNDVGGFFAPTLDVGFSAAELPYNKTFRAYAVGEPTVENPKSLWEQIAKPWPHDALWVNGIVKHPGKVPREATWGFRAVGDSQYWGMSIQELHDDGTSSFSFQATREAPGALVIGDEGYEYYESYGDNMRAVYFPGHNVIVAQGCGYEATDCRYFIGQP